MIKPAVARGSKTRFDAYVCMPQRYGIPAIAAMICGIALAGVAVAQTAAAPAGWFTRDQAMRGREQYRAHCSACHADNLAGIGPAPPLAGGTFLAHWSNASVWNLLDLVRATMPQNAPRTLDDAAYADVVAYILRANNFPIGDSELPVDSGRLQKMPMASGTP